MDETVGFFQPFNLKFSFTTGIEIELKLALATGISDIIVRWLGKLPTLMHDSERAMSRFEQETFRDFHEFIVPGVGSRPPQPTQGKNPIIRMHVREKLLAQPDEIFFFIRPVPFPSSINFEMCR
jgi:hypothetical protein